MAAYHLAAAGLAAAGLVAIAAPARAQDWGGGIGSSAYALAAHFVAGGDATSLRPAPVARGDGGFRYDNKADRASVSETLAIAAGGAQIATLTVTATKVATQAESKGIAIDVVMPSANGSIGTLTLTLQSYPPPPSGPAPAPLLAITASDLAWQASDSETFPKPPVFTAGGSEGAMTITGTLVNGDTFNVSGTQAANDAIDIPPATGGNVRFTFNRQVTPGAVVCKSSCAFAAHGIHLALLAIKFEEVSVGGTALSGEIVLGGARAFVGP